MEHVGKDGRRTVALPVTAPPPGELRNYEIVAEARGISARQNGALSFVPAHRFTSPPAMDGKLDDWPELHALPGTDGETALSVGWGWDTGHLFLAVRVRDTVHYQRQKPFATWQNDSLQIGIAPAQTEALVRPPNTGLQEADYVELDAALKQGAALLYCHRTVNKHLAPPGSVSQQAVKRAFRHATGTTVYELAIPTGQFGANPLQAHQVIRAALLANDADEEGGGIERRTTAWFDGIKRSKDPGKFGHVILRP